MFARRPWILGSVVMATAWCGVLVWNERQADASWALRVLPSLAWSSAEAVTGGARVVSLPSHPSPGWWFARIQKESGAWPAELHIRMTMPYDHPTPVHLHVLLLPEGADRRFVGNAQGWLWHTDGSTILTPGQIVQPVSFATPRRVAPSLLNPPAAVTHRVAWGPVSLSLGWESADMTSHLAHHGALVHAEVLEFQAGERTGWLTLAVGSWASGLSASSVLVAVAPYHWTPAGDHALALYRPDPTLTTSAPPTQSRSERDYPNDPTVLWDQLHVNAGSGWYEQAMVTLSETAGGRAGESERFALAWSAGVHGFSRWSVASPDSGQTIHVPVIRPPNLKIDRALSLPTGVSSVAQAVAHFPQTVRGVFAQRYGIGALAPDVWGTPPSTPAALPALDAQLAQIWLANLRFTASAVQLRGLAGSQDLQFPGPPRFSDVLNKWISFMPMDGVTSLQLLFQWAYLDYLLQARGLHVYSDIHFDFQLFQYVYSTVIAPDTATSAQSWISSMGFMYMFFGLIFPYSPVVEVNAAKQEAEDFAFQVYAQLAAWGNDASRLRYPAAMAVIHPPFFGQLDALASLELPNLAWHWWRQSAVGLHGALPSLGGDPPQGFDPDALPWEGWFPTGSAPGNDAWWNDYQQLPWAKLAKDPSMPDWSNPLDYRFENSSITLLRWRSALWEGKSWPIQPPATRETTDGNRFGAVVLPTSAYVMGHMELRVKP